MKRVLKGAFAVLATVGLSAVVGGCKTTAERTKEQSQTQNSLTNYVKTPQDRARNMKSKVEAAQNHVAEQGRTAAEGE